LSLWGARAFGRDADQEVTPMRSRQPIRCGTEHLPVQARRQPELAWWAACWHLIAWHVVSGWHRGQARWRALARAWQSAQGRHPALRYAQIIPIAFVLFGLDYAASFRAGAAAAGLRNAVTVNSVTMDIGGGFAHVMNDWLATHHVATLAATWYYIVMQGALTGVLGALLIWRRVPSFPLHRNALIAVTALGLVAFWNYPVAPPRLLPGYHDVIAAALPTFAKVVEPNGSATYAALPSLHVAWALWAAIAAMTLVRRPALRALIWLYPAATIVDVLATANHYLLDAVTAVGLLLLGYLLAVAADRARTYLAGRQATAAHSGLGTWTPRLVPSRDGASSIPPVSGYWASPPPAASRGDKGSASNAIGTGCGGYRQVTEPHGAVLTCALPDADPSARGAGDSPHRR
jgi:PAP2 superfamily